MKLSIPYGHRPQELEIDASRVIAETSRADAGGIDDVGAAVEQAMSHPIGPRLDEVIARGDRVLVMTVDHTRPNPSPLLRPLLERIESLGGKPEVMIGLGNHRPMSEEALQGFLGTTQVHQNASRDPEQWRLGVTSHGTPIEVSPILREFDRRVVVGFIEPHYLAGFSGGRKMILPGVSSHRSITRNHFMSLLQGPMVGILRGNPLHEDMEEAALAVGVDWICDAVVTPSDEFHSIHCGDMLEAHARGVEAARVLYSHVVPRRADIVITSAGGWPYDGDMVQAKKALAPALDCVKRGGVVILVGECANGWGASEPEWDLLRPECALEVRGEIEDGLRRGELCREWPPCSPGLLFSRVVHDHPARLIVVSKLADQLAETYLETADTVAEALAMGEETVGERAEVIVIHDGRRAICRVEADG